MIRFLLAVSVVLLAGCTGDAPIADSEPSGSNDRPNILLIVADDKAFSDLGKFDGDRVHLINFNDAGFRWHLFEIATSLYFILGEPFFEQARDALIRGYRRQRQLPDEQLVLLPLFFLARGLTYVSWVHTRRETETAKELTPMLLTAACELAEGYLSN